MKKFLHSLIKAVLIRGGVLFLAGTLLSCGENSGLGPSVDTEEPKIDISYPDSLVAIKEDFILAGTCSDDKGVSRIEVSWTNPRTGEKETKIVTPENDKWYVSLNEVLKNNDGTVQTNDFGLPVYSLPDGEVEFTVVAYDAAGHSSGKIPRAFRIDNTPPVFFITSPQIDSDDDDDTTNYGTKLKIVGTIADDNDISKMTVVVRDTEGNVVADSETNPITVNNVTTAGGTSETIASFLNIAKGENEYNDNYINIYFDKDPNQTGTVEYTCEISLVDSAQVYKNPPDVEIDSSARAVTGTTTVTSGNNSNNMLYAYYNIRDIVGSDVFDARTMIKVINGTYTGDDVDTLKAALLGEGNFKTSAKFTLNPKANPTYNLIGFGISTSENDDSKSWSESTRDAAVSLSAQMGLNQDPLVKQSVRLYLLGPVEVQYDYTMSTGSSGKREVLVDFLDSKRQSVAELYSDFEDLSDEFYANYDSESKTITGEETIFENFKSKNAELLEKITGLESDNANFYFEKLEMSGAATGSGESYTYPYKVPESLPLAGKAYLAFVTGWDKEGLVFTNGSNFYGFKFSVNSNAPSFEGVTFKTENNDSVAADSYTNISNLSITGTAKSDSNSISKVEYVLTLVDEGSSGDNTTVSEFPNSIEGKEEFSGTSASETFTFDLFEKLTDSQKATLNATDYRYLYQVLLTAYDTMNKSYKSQYIVHIDRKDPVIEFTNAKVVAEDSAGKKWIGPNGLSLVQVSIDEENPKNVSYEIKKGEEVVKSNNSLGPKYSLAMTADDFSDVTFSGGDSVSVKITVVDKAGNEASEESDTYTVDATPPVIVSDATGEKAILIGGKNYVAGKENWLKDTALTFKGYYTEADSGVNAVYYVINPENAPSKGSEVKAAEHAIGADSNGMFSSTISGFSTSGKSTIWFAAEDNVGNLSSVNSYDVYIDQNPPTFEEIDEDARNIPMNGSANKTATFTVKDQENASGIDVDAISVTAFMNGTEYPLLGENDCKVDYDEDTGVGTLTITKEYVTETHDSKDGKKTGQRLNGNVTLQIVVPDKAGNTSTNQQFVLQVDSSAPTVKVTSPVAVDSSVTDVAKISWITGKTTIMGTINDVGVSGVDPSAFKYLIPTVTQQKEIASKTTASEKVEALASAEWKAFDSDKNDGVTWSISYQSSYLESPTGKTGTISAGKDSFVYYGAANTSGTLTYATEFGTTDAEKKRYRTVPVYFLVTDLAGNQDVITDNVFYVDIEGGKPSTKISYPKDSTSDGETTWAKISEEVALQGTAQDNEAVTKVYLKELWYATDANSVTAATVASGYNAAASTDTFTGWKRAQSDDVDLISVEGVTLTKSESGDLVITQVVSGTSVVEAFDIEFNLTPLAESLAKKNPAEKILAIKAVVSAEDENEYAYSSKRYAFVDTETPVLSNERIVKLSASIGDTAEIATFANGKVTTKGTSSQEADVLVDRKYETDMWISGAEGAVWYYIATVTDDSVVQGVKLASQSHTTSTTTFATPTVTDKTKYGGITPTEKTTSYTFAIKIPTGEDGNLYSKLTRDDGSHKDVNSYISLNIDNTAPQMRDATEKFVEFTEDNASKLKLVADGDLGEKYVVENSNGSFSFGDQVQEKGSGLAFIGFWFERNSKKNVYNPVIKDTAANTYKAGVAAANQSTATYSTTKTNGSVYLNSDNFPALYVSGAAVSTETIDEKPYTAITYASLSSNNFINHAYGMVKINGSYYKVQKIADTKVILDSDLGLTSSTVDVEFIYANFVDHVGTETYTLSTDGSTYTVSNDDDTDNANGDGIAESLKVKSGVYTWTAEFDSNNMPDGPARINVVTMDNAGNMSYAYVDTSIQNNRPRIAKVFLATDLNGNGTFDFYSESDGFGTKIESGNAKYNAKNPNKYDLDTLTVENGTELGEFMFFSTLDEDGNAKALATVKDKGVNNNFIVMDKFLVLPEIVGGNTTLGDLKYTYDVVDKADSVAVKKSESETDLGTFVSGTDLTALLATKSDSKVDVSILPSKGIYFGKNLTESPSVGTKDALYNYESWTQKTEGGTVTETKTTKFFGFTIWDATGVDDSSIKQGENTLWALLSVPVVVNVKDDIAPKPTITPFYWNSKEDSSTVYDEENQPEGHIDYLNSSDKVMAKPGVAGKIYLEGVAKDDSRVDEIYITDPNGTEALVAKRNSGTDSDSKPWLTTKTDLLTTWPTNWLSFTILDEDEPTQKGNSVYWQLKIDTSTYGVASGKTFTVSAKDKSDNKSTPGTAQTKDPEQTKVTTDVNTDYYEMDFVPYIKSISLSDGTVLRSRLGRYSVRAGEDIIINGMNFGTSGTATVHFYKSKTDGSQGDEDGSGTSATISNNSVTISAPSYSRFVAVTVGEQTTQNNVNSNARGYNIEEGYIKNETTIAKTVKEKNLGLDAANLNGTDFWTDDRYLAVWNVETTFTGSINPHSGVIKKVTEANTHNGVLYGQEDSTGGVPVSDLKETYYSALSSDDLRIYTYGLNNQTVDTSDTSKSSVSYQYVFGINNTDIFRVPADALDMVIIKGVPYYVVQDNWVGNVQANCWGPGLFLGRVGWQWDKTNMNSDQHPANDNDYEVIIEKQGDSGTAMGRADKAGTGYDYVLYQFKNPRIAGWNSTAEGKQIKWTTNGGVSNPYGESTDYIYVSYYDSYARCLKYAAYRAARRMDDEHIKFEVSEWGQKQLGNSKGGLVAEMRSGNGNMTNGKTVVAGFDNVNSSPTQFKEEAGEWSDIMVDVTTENDPHPVIIYYNKTAKSLEVAYGKTAFPTYDEGNGNVVAKGAAYNSVTDHSGDGWTKTKGITPNEKVDFGRYVSAAMDKEGNLHVAAQDATNAKLYYLFLKKSGTSYTLDKKSIVDATSGAGRWTDIELTNPSGTTPETCKPVISYINTSFLGTTHGVKTAYYEKKDSSGNPVFEAMTDPAKWQAGDQRTSVLPDVKETKSATGKAIVGVGFNSDMLALDFLRGE